MSTIPCTCLFDKPGDPSDPGLKRCLIHIATPIPDPTPPQVDYDPVYDDPAIQERRSPFL